MNLKNSFYLVLVIFFISHCESSKNTKDKYLQKSIKDWTPYLKKMGLDSFDDNRHVLLIMSTTVCEPCVKELEWWNNEGIKIKNLNISSIIIEKYESSFKTYLVSKNFKMPVYQDSVALIFEDELIPYTPVKVYFNKKQEVAAIENMGTNGRLSSFVSKIQKDNRN